MTDNSACQQCFPPHLCAGKSARQCTWTDATMNDSVNCQMWKSCKACTPGTLLILCPRSDIQICGGVACSKSIPYLHTWRNGPVKQNNSHSQRRSRQNKSATNMVTWSGHTESDLRHCYDNQNNNCQQGKARIQVD